MKGRIGDDAAFDRGGGEDRRGRRHDQTRVFKSAEREELFKYSDRLVDDNVVVAVAKGKEFPCAQASDLSGKRIGVQSSFCDGDAFDAVKPRRP